jgi:putative colanic acid biosynthesis acetyltransferase WcaF
MWDTVIEPEMAKKAFYNAAEQIPPETAADPYLRPAFDTRDRSRRFLWNLCHAMLYRTSPRPLHGWRTFLLRCFGAQMGPDCHFYPNSKIWAPWNLVCAENVTAADGVEIYNPAPMRFGSHAILSQDAFLCGATHDFDDPGFPLLAYAMEFGPYSWICARAIVAPGVSVGEGTVLGLGSVATRDLEPWGVYAGVPATKIKDRRRTSSAGL